MMRAYRPSIPAAAAILLAAGAIVPLIAVVALSLRPQAMFITPRDLLPPVSPQLESFAAVFAEPGFLRAVVNSSILAVATLASNLVLGLLTAFAFLNVTDRGRRMLVVTAIIGVAAPQQAMVVPLFLIFTRWGLLDTWGALIIPALIAPANLLILFHAIRGIPTSLIEAARVDGATDVTLLRRVIAPLLRPALGIVAINTFVGSWSSFLLPFLLTSSASHRTLPVALALLKTSDQVRWSVIAAGAVITAIPVAVVFLLARRHLLEATFAGSVKG